MQGKLTQYLGHITEARFIANVVEGQDTIYPGHMTIPEGSGPPNFVGVGYFHVVNGQFHEAHQMWNAVNVYLSGDDCRSRQGGKLECVSDEGRLSAARGSYNGQVDIGECFNGGGLMILSVSVCPASFMVDGTSTCELIRTGEWVRLRDKTRARGVVGDVGEFGVRVRGLQGLHAEESLFEPSCPALLLIRSSPTPTPKLPDDVSVGVARNVGIKGADFVCFKTGLRGRTCCGAPSPS